MREAEAIATAAPQSSAISMVWGSCRVWVGSEGWASPRVTCSRRPLLYKQQQCVGDVGMQAATESAHASLLKCSCSTCERCCYEKTVPMLGLGDTHPDCNARAQEHDACVTCSATRQPAAAAASVRRITRNHRHYSSTQARDAAPVAQHKVLGIELNELHAAAKTVV